MICILNHSDTSNPATHIFSRRKTVRMLKETTKHLVLEIVKTDTNASASDLSLVAAALDTNLPRRLGKGKNYL